MMTGYFVCCAAVLRVLAYCFSKQQILDSRILLDILSPGRASRHPRAEASVFSIYVAGPQHSNSPTVANGAAATCTSEILEVLSYTVF